MYKNIHIDIYFTFQIYKDSNKKDAKSKEEEYCNVTNTILEITKRLNRNNRTIKNKIENTGLWRMPMGN